MYGRNSEWIDGMNNFYLIFGPDRSIVNNELNKVIEKLKIEDVVKYDMTASSLLDVIEDASTVGLFSDSKIIVLDDCYFLGANKTIDDIEELEKYLDKYNSNNYCILVAYLEKVDTRKKIYKLLKSKAKIIEQVKIDDDYLISYVKEELKREEYKIENIDYFLDKVGKNLYNVKNELNKLMMYKLETKDIRNIDIDKIVVKSMEEEIFALTDAIIAKNTDTSLRLLEEFLNKDYEEIQIIMLLASQFRFLFQVKRLINKGKSEGEIAKILEVNPYRVKFTVKKLYSYTEEMLLNYIQKLAKIDHDVKLGLMDKRLALELFIINNK